MKDILLIEDEASVVSFIRKGLTEEGYRVSVALDGATGLQMALNNPFDLLVIDVMLPGINGLEICEEVRKQNKKVAILFLTALGTAENVVLGLERGADDYLVKPFKFIELLARIRSVLRRYDTPDTTGQEATAEHRYALAGLEVDDLAKTVKREGKLISLTSTEYRLLLLLIRNKRKVFSRLEILENVWNVDFDMGTNVVDVYVNYLRKKIDRDHTQKLIHTVVGMGYVLKEAE